MRYSQKRPHSKRDDGSSALTKTVETRDENLMRRPRGIRSTENGEAHLELVESGVGLAGALHAVPLVPGGGHVLHAAVLGECKLVEDDRIVENE